MRFLILTLLALTACTTTTTAIHKRSAPIDPNAVVDHTVKPELLNSREVQLAMSREYSRLSTETGTTVVRIFINEWGIVQDQLVEVSSGHDKLDAAALRIVTVARFSPAKNRDKTVAIWISMDIACCSPTTKETRP